MLLLLKNDVDFTASTTIGWGAMVCIHDWKKVKCQLYWGREQLGLLTLAVIPVFTPVCAYVYVYKRQFMCRVLVCVCVC